MNPEKGQILLTLSAETEEKLQEAARLYEISSVCIINKIIEESLPKWIQKYHMQHSFNKAVEKAKATRGSEEILIQQDELDKIMRLMSSPHKPEV
jgi:hypothetical protein